MLPSGLEVNSRVGESLVVRDYVGEVNNCCYNFEGGFAGSCSCLNYYFGNVTYLAARNCLQDDSYHYLLADCCTLHY